MCIHNKFQFKDTLLTQNKWLRDKTIKQLYRIPQNKKIYINYMNGYTQYIKMEDTRH